MNKFTLIFATTLYLFFVLSGTFLFDPPSSDGHLHLHHSRKTDVKLKLLKPKNKTDFHTIAHSICPTKLWRPSLDLKSFVSAVNSASVEFGLEESLLYAVIAVESSCNPLAVSPRGAVGLMQLMPDTAYGLGVKDPLSVDGNIKGGAKYLRKLLDEFDWDVELALAAYNAGPGSVRKYQAIPPYRETRKYVGKVLDFYNKIQAERV
jgi:soluble lytic murein transglycosylase-like protein